ncbi:DsbE family thiol:disulfide interchange protein [Ideonella livida]|uniref:DsbE family thiol:disulfide interchange protein n=1 Tax=Ideonella livida TaxID=2707176 RepID=A0A7C9TJY1_9BURK|nr:DsbE family thiol:disulfide interchange protein [Ideonella livida]NDY91482.1 DsbE family thiol:disulfide interchange protein [Ideonella livida]
MSAESLTPGVAPAAAGRRRWGLWLAGASGVGLLGLLGVGMGRDPRELPSVRLGQPWPARPMPQLGGGPAVDPATWRGKPRLVNLWASWCATCVEEQPVLLALARSLQAQGRADQLIGLNYKDAPADAQAWLRRHGNPFAQQVVDADGRLAIDLGVYGAPETFVVDAQGRIAYRHVGALTPEVIARELLPRLAGAGAGGRA